MNYCIFVVMVNELQGCDLFNERDIIHLSSLSYLATSTFSSLSGCQNSPFEGVSGPLDAIFLVSRQELEF